MRLAFPSVEGLDPPFLSCDELSVDIAPGAYVRVNAVREVKLLVLLGGDFSLEREERTPVNVGPGDRILAAGFQAYRYRPLDPRRPTVLRALRVLCDTRLVHTGPIEPRLLPAFASADSLRVAHSGRRSAELLVEALREACRLRSDDRGARVSSLLRCLFEEIGRDLSAPDRHTGPKTRARLLAEDILTLIEEKPGKSWTLDEIAWRCGVCAEHAARVFKAELGETVFAVLTRLRIEEAKRLLTHSDAAIGDIAIRCGMGDPTAFGRRFRAVTGQTPGTYRRTLLSGVSVVKS